MFPAFEIPGEIARDLGAPNIAKVLDVLFVGDNAATDYAYSLLSSEDGPINTLFVKLPKAIAEALSVPPEEAATESPPRPRPRW